ncbi:DUF6175 family protein [Myroides odoratimimus]|uniref:DUF6175 family protein n=1 Tax=Myroides odoratimimus TaxID=76832 RepID=UPI0038D41C1A
MKNKFLTICLCLLSVGMFAQAKKPSLMVVPSDSWCTKNRVMEVYYNQGVEEYIPDYKLALLHSDLMNVISKINILMADRGFPLKDLSATMKAINKTNVENNLITSKASGAALAESPLDRVRRTAKSDIILEVDWTINATGPKKSITYNLRALDAYTSKQVAGAQGTGAPSFSADVAVLLEEAVLVNMDSFVNQLQAHFDDLLTNGREVTLDILVFDNGSGVDLETEFDGTELTEVIDNWLAEKTVNHRFSKADATETMTLYESVRIPLYKANGMAQDTDGFARELRTFLKKAPYNLEAKLINRGLGRAALVIGEK